ncbi:MED6-domain-containing protein [Roridomyces roridus]|uniref:Mediator of RNA polymerase II transcription subunit 6 n=1 Tax=Roridomyces roridus TaxID=1738132 RepID=A0AAD7FPD6_9AGAR|nr:MED6-domain-containing protein [Roridomyces roridus]
MDVSDLHPADDYSHRFFIWHEWIQANGPLNTENVFEYFATSMFYDKQSNNQPRNSGMPLSTDSVKQLKWRPRRFTGVEFAVVHAQPPSMFVIHKRERLSPDEVRPLAAYFIMNNRIYQSPDVYTVLSNRLLTSLCSLQSSLDILRSRRPDYIPRTGFVWPIVDPATQQDDLKKKTTAEEGDNQSVTDVPESKPKVPQRQQNNLLLMNAMRATALHSKTAFSASVSEATNAAEPEPATPATQGPRNSATPAPTPAAKTPSAIPVIQEPSSRGPAGAGKKKRKRTLPAPTA